MNKQFVPLMFALLILVSNQPFDVSEQTCLQIDDGTIWQVSEKYDIDLFTQKGGRGYFVSCPPFNSSEEVILYANVTYNDYPEQNNDVSFQIFNPQNNSFILFARTNASGIATTSFRLPEIFGTWRVLATVSIADVVVNDTLEFHARWNLADINHDLKIDIYDVVRITGIYNSEQGDPNWNCHSDIAEPYGIINIYDVVTCTGQYGKEHTP